MARSAICCTPPSGAIFALRMDLSSTGSQGDEWVPLQIVLKGSGEYESSSESSLSFASESDSPSPATPLASQIKSESVIRIEESWRIPQRSPAILAISSNVLDLNHTHVPTRPTLFIFRKRAPAHSTVRISAPLDDLPLPPCTLGITERRPKFMLWGRRVVHEES